MRQVTGQTSVTEVARSLTVCITLIVTRKARAGEVKILGVMLPQQTVAVALVPQTTAATMVPPWFH